MKKTPAILMSTALLTIPCTESIAQKPTTADSIIKTDLMRHSPVAPCKERYYELVGEYADHYDEITDELRFLGDLGYNSFDFLNLIQDISEEFFNASLDLPTSEFTMDQNLKVGDVWDTILETWEELYGETI